MKSDRYVLYIALMSWLILNTAFSELRIWTDQTGKTLEAEYVATLGDKVVLRQPDGSEIRVSFDTLSKEDQKVAVLLAPPRIEIRVSTNTDRENTGRGGGKYGGFQVQKEAVQCDVEIQKTSSTPYEASLNAELYLFGKPENKDFYIVLDETQDPFSFAQEKKYSFSSAPVMLTQLEAGKQTGIEYEGYLAVVKDKSGAVLSVKSNKPLFEKNAEAIMGAKRGSTFDSEFNSIERSGEKGKNNPRKKMSHRKVPGRRF